MHVTLLGGGTESGLEGESHKVFAEQVMSFFCSLQNSQARFDEEPDWKRVFFVPSKLHMC